MCAHPSNQRFKDLFKENGVSLESKNKSALVSSASTQRDCYVRKQAKFYLDHDECRPRKQPRAASRTRRNQRSSSGPTRTKGNHDFKIRPRTARTNYFKFSFFNRYVNDWNSLPNSVISASSLNVFKNRLFNYLCT